MAKAKGAGPKPSGKKLLKGGSKRGSVGGGKQTANGFPAGVVPTQPAQSGAPDVVHDRTAQAMQGVMESKQLRKNKSKGLTL